LLAAPKTKLFNFLSSFFRLTPNPQAHWGLTKDKKKAKKK